MFDPCGLFLAELTHPRECLASFLTTLRPFLFRSRFFGQWFENRKKFCIGPKGSVNCSSDRLRVKDGSLSPATSADQFPDFRSQISRYQHYGEVFEVDAFLVFG
jgi:hypothetical protein